jgi:hypothetical protein
VADRAGLENRCGGNITEGSNPSLSAEKGHKHLKNKGLWPYYLKPFTNVSGGRIEDEIPFWEIEKSVIKGVEPGLPGTIAPSLPET